MAPWDLIKELEIGGEQWRGHPRNRKSWHQGVEYQVTSQDSGGRAGSEGKGQGRLKA